MRAIANMFAKDFKQNKYQLSRNKHRSEADEQPQHIAKYYETCLYRLD